MSAWICRHSTARPPIRLFHLVFESHSGRAFVPIPKRSASPRVTPTPQSWIGLKALDPDRPIREADISARFVAYGLIFPKSFEAVGRRCGFAMFSGSP